MDEPIYRGEPGEHERVQIVRSGSATEPTRVGLLAHHVKHSPTGFSWGYAGSGPSELARCLLIDALGDRAICPTCTGTRKVFPDEASDGFRPARDGDDPDAVGSCIDCDAGFGPEVERCYQTFKFEVVAAWPMNDPWQISRAEILAWHAQHMLAVSSTRH
jgi:hypothetical protein